MDSSGADAPKADKAKLRWRFLTIYWVLMLNAVGVSALFSVLPSFGRVAHIPDTLVVTAQSLSAIAWVFVASFWSIMSAKRGHRWVMTVGAVGSTLATALTGLAVYVGAHHLVAPAMALIMLMVARSIYGSIGLANGPAGQAFIAQNTTRHERTSALSTLGSAQWLGSVIGPALSALLISLPVLGLSAPLFLLAALMLTTLPLVLYVMPPHSVTGPTPSERAQRESIWRIRSVRSHLIFSALTALSASATLQTVGFLIIDQSKGSAVEAQPAVAQAYILCAIAALLCQLVFVPMLKPSARWLMLAGPLIAGAGCLTLAGAPSYAVILVGSVLLNMGVALARPGVTADASLMLPPDRQQDMAGALLSTLSLGIVAGPIIGVSLYGVWKPLTFLLVALLLAIAFIIGLRIRTPAADERAG